MSKRSKLEKFAENLQLPNVFENFSFEDPHLYSGADRQVDYKGRWSREYFGNDHDLVLELACGRGEYCLGLAKLYPAKNFIGVDIKGARIWKGAKTALFLGLQNVAFVRTRIEMISRYFDQGEVSEIWITFPDPFLRKSKSERRLTSQSFLDRYMEILKPGAMLYLKTDDPTLYEFSLECIEAHPQYNLVKCCENIYAQSAIEPEYNIQTYYERMHRDKGKYIRYIQFQFKSK